MAFGTPLFSVDNKRARNDANEHFLQSDVRYWPLAECVAALHESAFDAKQTRSPKSGRKNLTGTGRWRSQ